MLVFTSFKIKRQIMGMSVWYRSAANEPTVVALFGNTQPMPQHTPKMLPLLGAFQIISKKIDMTLP
jgi:hypothetical protein